MKRKGKKKEQNIHSAVGHSWWSKNGVCVCVCSFVYTRKEGYVYEYCIVCVNICKNISKNKYKGKNEK